MLVLKTLLAPALIGLASTISRRYGPTAGGWFAALPLTSGPVVLIFALERGTAFAAQACVGVLLALIPLTAFTLAYAWAAQRLTWVWSSALACAAYLGCAWAVAPAALSILEGFVVACALLLFALRLMPRTTTHACDPVTTAWDIPLRMLLAAILVSVLTSAAGGFGPRISGLLTPFPVAATLLAAFTHHAEGEAAAARLLYGLLAGLFSFALFFLVVGTFVERWGIAPAFSAASLAALALQCAVWRFSSLGAASHDRVLPGSGVPIE
jgi:hypothetical protein